MSEPLTLEQLLEQWPNDDSGKMAARLLTRYLITKLVESAAGAESTAERAQAESGANKAHADIIRDIRDLGKGDIAKPAARPKLKGLNRFSEPEPEKNPEK